MRRHGTWFAAAWLVAALSLPAFASGFSVYEQSAKASGMAGAWVARADDAAANWYNPAALVRLDGQELQLGVNLITIGIDTEIEVTDASWLALIGEAPPRTFEAEQSNETPAQLYYSWKVSDNVAFGFGVNNPFGLATEWRDLPISYSSERVELVTFVANPNLSWKVSKNWSLALGLDYLYADVGEFSRRVDQSALLQLAPGTVVGKSDLTGDGDDWGFNLAAHFAEGPWSFGATFRSALSPEIEGDVAFTGINENLAPLFPDGPGTTTLDLPAQAAVGLGYDVSEKLSLEFDISWAEWSRFQMLAVDLQNETAVSGPFGPIPVVADIEQIENWENTYAFRFGAAWKISDAQELRFGALYDQNPIPNETLRPSIPDADRVSVTFGYGYAGKRWSIDAYYMPLFFMDRDAKGNPAGKPSANPYQRVDGVIDGTYKSFTHLLGVSVAFRF